MSVKSNLQKPISISGFLENNFPYLYFPHPPAAGTDPAAFLFAQLSGQTQLVERNRRHPDQGEDNPNHKGVAGQRKGLKEVIGGDWYIAKVNLIRHSRRVSV